MQLAYATWQEVEDHLRGTDGVIVPIGSTEQHGPNGLIVSRPKPVQKHQHRPAFFTR